MSRCFPFPPPGYERKHNPEDLNLLKEAKRKEKKHKKEKKDKERKKDIEKEKDGGDEKHKEKKDRKEKHRDKKDKHRDKKKDKEDRGKEKDKSSISEESTVARKAEEHSGGKLHAKGEGKDSNFALFQSQNGGKHSQSNLSSQGIEDSKFVQELDRRIREEKKGRGSQLPERVSLLDKKDQEMAGRTTVRNSLAVRTEGKDDNKHKKIDSKMDSQGPTSNNIGDALVPNTTVMSQSKVERIARPLDGQNGKRLEDKEKYKETCDINQGHKQNDKESHRKEKDKEKEKKRLDGARLKSESKSKQGKLKEDVRNNLDALTSACQGPIMLQETNSNATNEANTRKRKDMDTNGFLHENEIRPNKMHKPAPHQSTENGRKSEGLPTPNKTPNNKHVINNSIWVDKRDHLGNGMVEAQEPSLSKPKSSSATMVIDQIVKAPKLPPHDSKVSNKTTKVPEIEDLIAEAARRPPHPDSKYLPGVLTVPKMVDCSEVDDQDWWFKIPSMAPKGRPTGVREDPSVWSEAVHIESVDVCALPYVIPY